MDVIYALIPSMIFIGLGMVGLLYWAARSGQFEDLEGDAQRILMEDDFLDNKPQEKKELSTTATDENKS